MSALATKWTQELAPTPASASIARRLLADALLACDHEEWLDAAQLAVSEIITNGVLHAHTALMLSARCSPAELRVEVLDTNPALPSQRQYGQEATTGRGMMLIAAVTTSSGVIPVDGGKIVWFVISAAAAEPNAEDLLAAWSDDEGDLPSPSSDGRVVTLAGLPPTLWSAAVQHHDGLLRELALYRRGREQTVDDLVVADRARFAIRSALDRALAAARAEGRARNPLPATHPARMEEVPELLDLEVEVLGEDPAADFSVMQDVLDEAERLAGHGQLLSRPGLPEIIALRDWAAESTIAQLNGQHPAPWPGAAAERFAQSVDERARQVDFDVSHVRDADRGAIAADDANRILAISRSLAQALGWEPDDLVGRRVVAIVPPRFREAHVAGFTRHLTTGQAHALNVRLELPVLHADASEIPCEFYIEAHRSNSGRAVYIAWVTPLPADPPARPQS